MSTEISTAFVNQFSSTFFHVAQQKGSRLRSAVRVESQKGQYAFYDVIGSITASISSTRHEDTPISDTPHTRRRVGLNIYKHGDLFDDQDRVQVLIDPTSGYMQAFSWAFGRAMDNEILDAASASADTGVAGGTPVALPTSQKICAVDAGAGSNLNVEALLNAKYVLDAADVDPEMPRYLALNASMLQSLLSQTEVTNSDYNTVKALVQGELDTFCGFKIIRTELLNTQSGSLKFNAATGDYDAAGAVDANGYSKAIAWAQDGLLLSIGRDFKGRITERDDKCYSLQVYAQMQVGATRMQENKVVEILCND